LTATRFDRQNAAQQIAATTAWPPSSHAQAVSARRVQRSDAPQASDAKMEKKDKNIPSPGSRGRVAWGAGKGGG